MRCLWCQADINLGGAPPRRFLAVAGACILGGLITAVVGLGLPEGFGRDVAWGLAVAGGVSCVIALAAVWTNMGDACTMGPGGWTQGGVQCGACGRVNRIRPWSG